MPFSPHQHPHSLLRSLDTNKTKRAITFSELNLLEKTRVWSVKEGKPLNFPPRRVNSNWTRVLLRIARRAQFASELFFPLNAVTCLQKKKYSLAGQQFYLPPAGDGINFSGPSKKKSAEKNINLLGLGEPAPNKSLFPIHLGPERSVAF